MSDFFKELELHEPLRRVQFYLFESANYFQIEREKPYDYLLIIQISKNPRRVSVESYFLK